MGGINTNFVKKTARRLAEIQSRETHVCRHVHVSSEECRTKPFLKVTKSFQKCGKVRMRGKGHYKIKQNTGKIKRRLNSRKVRVSPLVSESSAPVHYLRICTLK